MKRIIVAILLSTLLLTGCGSKETKEIMDDNIVLIKVEQNVAFGYPLYTIYDKETKVIYLYGERIGITPLYNADGTLRIYEEDN